MAHTLTDVAWLLVALALAAATWRWWARFTEDLRLSLFRPWRGDPWPHGVQEDDDFLFVWTSAAATEDTPERIDDDPGPSVQELRTGSVQVHRLDRFDVHRPGH